MSFEKTSIALVASDLYNNKLCLQPWRYLYEVANGLAREGHKVTLLSDGSKGLQYEDLAGLPVIRLASLRSLSGRRLAFLKHALEQIQPQYIIWNIGLTSLLYQNLNIYPTAANFAIFTSPIYDLKELTHLGIGKLYKNFSFIAVHLLGTLIPWNILKNRLKVSGLHALVVQTHTTQRQVQERGLWSGSLKVIPPGIDLVWQTVTPEEASIARQALGYTPQDCVVVYYGSPSPLRGLPTLIHAMEIAREKNKTLKLLVLSRRRFGEFEAEDHSLRLLTKSDSTGIFLRSVDGFLDRSVLARHVAACDVVALPFELVPSDAPLSVLEAQVLGKPLVTTRLACLPELAAGGLNFLAEPGDPHSLARALLQAAEAIREPDIEHPKQSTGFDWKVTVNEWSQIIERL